MKPWERDYSQPQAQDLKPWELDYSQDANQDHLTAHLNQLPLDGFLSSVGKAIGNMPRRMIDSGYGILAAIGESTPTDTRDTPYFDQVKGYLETSPNMPNEFRDQVVADYLQKSAGSGPLSPGLAEYARDAHGNIQEVIQEHAPNVAPDATGTQFAVDVARGVSDMALPLTAGALTGGAATLPAFMAYAGGSKYNEYRDKGQSPRDSLNAAMFNMGTEGLLEKIPASALFKEGSSAVRRLTEAALGEGAQEGIASVLGQVYDARQLDDMTASQAIQNIDWSQAGYEALVGSAVGGVVSAPFSAAETLSDAIGQGNSVADLIESRRSHTKFYDELDKYAESGGNIKPDVKSGDNPSAVEVAKGQVSGDVEEDTTSFSQDTLDQGNANLEGIEEINTSYSQEYLDSASENEVIASKTHRKSKKLSPKASKAKADKMRKKAQMEIDMVMDKATKAEQAGGVNAVQEARAFEKTIKDKVSQAVSILDPIEPINISQFDEESFVKFAAGKGRRQAEAIANKLGAAHRLFTVDKKTGALTLDAPKLYKQIKPRNLDALSKPSRKTELQKEGVPNEAIGTETVSSAHASNDDYVQHSQQNTAEQPPPPVNQLNPEIVIRDQNQKQKKETIPEQSVQDKNNKTEESTKSFQPTHELGNGTPVIAAADEDNVWIDEQGDEYEENDIGEIKARTGTTNQSESPFGDDQGSRIDPTEAASRGTKPTQAKNDNDALTSLPDNIRSEQKHTRLSADSPKPDYEQQNTNSKGAAKKPNQEVGQSNIDAAANEAATSPTNELPEPTQAQKEANNYKVGKLKLHGLDISIENPKGSTRSGTDKSGKEWSQEIKHHYGDIKGTDAADGDNLDVFIGPHAEKHNAKIFVVDQIDPKTREFDEHKVMLGFASKGMAIKGYKANYEKGWKGIGGVTEMSLDEFKSWVKDGSHKNPLTSQIKVKKGKDGNLGQLVEPNEMVEPNKKQYTQDAATKENEDVSRIADGSSQDEQSKGARKPVSENKDTGNERTGGSRDSPGREVGSQQAQQRQSSEKDSSHQSSGKPGKGNSNSKRSRDDNQSGVAPNYRIKPEDRLGDGGAKTKARQNIDAIRIIKALESDGRPATKEEQARLVKYTGWGASELASNLFPAKGKPKDAWKDLHDELAGLLTKEELSTARRSTQYAHYTSEAVISSIYKGLGKLGFNGGLIFEPGAGIGHFAGLLPKSMAGNSHYSGVEFDGITAAIAKHLYPESSIKQADFTKFDVPENHYDMVIGNPPFSSTIVRSDRKYKANRFALHEYFFAKSIDSVRPGGLLVFVTSRYLMDKQNAKARDYLESRADLVGAMRLPQTAFKKNAVTEVVTDVLFLKKREVGAEPGGMAWADLKEIQTPEGAATINEYFADNPGHVLGENSLQGSMYGPNEYTVLAPKKPIEQVFDDAISTLPGDIYHTAGVDMEQRILDQQSADFTIGAIKRNSYYLKDGVLMQNKSGHGKKAKMKIKGRGEGLYKGAAEKIKQLLPVKEKAMQLLDAQLNGREYEQIQNSLNKAYDQFVKKHGPINKIEIRERKNRQGGRDEYEVTPNFPAPFWSDPDAAILTTLDEHNPITGEIQKGAILSERVMSPGKLPVIETPSDSLATSLNKYGKIDIAAMAEMLSISEQDLIESLGDMIYKNPVTGGYETQDEYLSGQVRKKLAEAQSAAEDDAAFNENVRALDKVQPKDIPPSSITARMGAVWIPSTDIQAFIKEMTGVDTSISYVRVANTWVVGDIKVNDAATASKYQTERVDGQKMIAAALNQMPVTVYDWHYDPDSKSKKRIINDEQTELAREKLTNLKTAFSKWIWNNPERAERLSSTYNATYNDIVPRKFDGSHLTLPGITSAIKLRPHQLRVVWRILQSGNTYMAHTVGSGKTMASVAAGMDQRRLGLVKKPMYAVPNHMLKQFSKEFLELYPTAKILVADEENFHTKNRAEFVARSATEDWDAVIITHSAFGLIKAPAQTEKMMLEKQLEEYRAALEDVPEEERATRKRMEKAIENAEQGMSVLESRKQDDGISFEQLGVDQLFVDEAHEFRKLSYATVQGNIKGIDPNGSQKSWDLFVKSRYLDDINPGRGLVLMSGTPVTNTMGEMFTLQRFMQPNELERKGLESFDAWSSQYAETKEITEQTAAGGYKIVTRLAKFVNLPELLRSFRDVADVIRSHDLDGYVTRPSVEGGGLQMVSVEASEQMKEFQQKLASRMESIEARKGPPKKGDDIMLTVITDGRHAAIDDRYINEGAGVNPDTKLNKMISEAYRTWTQTKDAVYMNRAGVAEPIKGSTQMIFADLGVSERKGFSAYTEIKRQLVEKGIPEKEIAYMRDFKKASARLKLFSDINSGKVKILIGSSRNMGTGVNAQQRLIRLHHLDAPWYPADMEQRVGRIVRQGNKNKLVKVTGYATKGTYDSTMFTLLETKQRFIDQMWTDDFSVREMDDLDGDADQYAMAKAISSGDERLIQKIGLEQEVQRLQRLRNAHYDEQLSSQQRKSRAKSSIDFNERKIAKIQNDIKSRVDTAGNRFFAVIGKKTFSDRKKAGTPLLSSITRLHNKADPDSSVTSVGSIAGFDIQVYIDKRSWKNKAHGERYSRPEVSISAASANSFVVKDGQGALGLIQKLENQARRLEADIEDAQYKKEKALTNIERADAVIGNLFDRDGELTSKTEELDRLNEDILGSPDSDKISHVEGKTQVKSDEPPLFSKKAGARKGLSPKALESIVNRFLGQYSGADDIKVRISEDSTVFPGFNAERDKGYVIPAQFKDNTLYLAASGFRSAREVRETLQEEIFVHKGLGFLSPDDRQQLYRDIQQAVADSPEVAKLWEQTKSDYGSIADDFHLSDEQRNRYFAEELLGTIAQRKISILRKGYNRIYRFFKKWMADRGWINPSIGSQELLQRIYQLAAAFRKGKRARLRNISDDIMSSDLDLPSFDRNTTDDIFADIDNNQDKKGLERGKELIKKSGNWILNHATEFSKNGGLNTITLDQLADISKKVLPSVGAYASSVERMLTERNKMQNGSAKLAMKWQKLSAQSKNRLAHVMHEATMEGIDPSRGSYKSSEVIIVGGMDNVHMALGKEITGNVSIEPQGVKATGANLKLLAKRKYKAGKTLKASINSSSSAEARQGYKRALDEWRKMRNAIARDKKRIKRFAPIRARFNGLDKDAQQIFVDARDMYLNRSDRMEAALLATVEHAGMADKQKKQAMSAIRSEFETARLDGIYFPLFRKGEYFVSTMKKRTDIANPKTYTKKPGRVYEVTHDGKKGYKVGSAGVTFDTQKEALEWSKTWATKESALASSKSRADLLGLNLKALEEGNGWVLKDSMYEKEFTMHNTGREAEKYAQSLGADYQDTKSGKLDQVETSQDFEVSGSFLSDVFGIMKKSGVANDTQDQVYQLYLQTLPELSQRKHFIHRKKTAGFSKNALEAFANNMTHQAHQISKLEAREELEQLIEAVSEQTKKVPQKDANLAGNIRDSLKKRHQWVMSPTNARWTNMTSSFGFVAFLGLSPAAALVNLTQTPIIGLPVLAAETGWKHAAKEMLKAAKMLNISETLTGDEAIKTSDLNSVEKRAFQIFEDSGKRNRSQAHMLAGIGDTDSLQNSQGYQRSMELVGHLFHKAEIANRDVTFLAAFRIAQKSHPKMTLKEQALWASHKVNEIHFNYENYNRAPIMQSDAAKLFLMFKSYSQNVIYFMLKNAHEWGKGGKSGRQAQTRLLGTLGITLAMGGISALPIGLVGAVTAGTYSNAKFGTKKTLQGAAGITALIAMASLMWDDDEPYDWDVEVRKFLRKTGGDELESLVFRGGVNMALGMDISSRISLDDLLVRSPYRELEGRDLAGHYLEQAAGPVIGFGLGSLTAAQLWREDHGYRALEKMSPKFAKDILKTIRYGADGVRNMRGDSVVDTDLLSMYGSELNAWNLLWQAAGFSPDKVTRQYTKTNDVKNYESELKRRKKRILTDFYMAYVANDPQGMRDAADHGVRWSKANPKAKPINSKTLRKSLNTRLRYSAESVHGTNIQKSYWYLLDELRADEYSNSSQRKQSTRRRMRREGRRSREDMALAGV